MGRGKRKKLKIPETRFEYQGKIRRPRKEMDAYLQKQWVFHAERLLRQGSSHNYIFSEIKKGKKGIVNDKQVHDIMSRANALIKRDSFERVFEIKTLHLARYNKNIAELLETEEYYYDGIFYSEMCIDGGGKIYYTEPGENDYTYFQWLNSRKRKIYLLQECVDSLVQKENLLRLVNMDWTVDVNEDVEITVKQQKETYDINLISFEEKLEMSALLMKARQTDDDINSVSEITRAEETEKANVMQVLPPVVELIKQETLPVVKDTNRIVDSTRKIKEAMRRLAAQKLKDAGANLDDNEKRLLE